MEHSRKILTCAVLGAIAASNGALAQEPVGSELEEVLVTGTLIRGIQPIGSQSIDLDEQAIVETGAVTTNELLATIPQVSNFFNQRPEVDPRGGDRLQVNRPNLRNLPGIDTQTGATTLVLMDGHRMAPMGTDVSSVDPDIIPSIVMQRVEVVTDGGSSLYGADAVGGVINFVTLDEFDGVKVDLGYDTGDDYDGWQASIIAGTSWEEGSGYIALATTDRDAVRISDRDWAAQGNWNEDGTVLTPSGTECLEPVGAVTSWYWYGAGWTDNPAAPGAGVMPVGDPCDIEGANALIPEQQRDNIYAGFTHRFSDSAHLNMKAYYMNRDTTYPKYPRGSTVSESSPNELGLIGTERGELYESSAVGFSFGAHPAYRGDSDYEVEIETWGITPEIVLDLGDSGWQSRNLFYYGISDNSVSQPGINRPKMLNYIDAGALDPLSVATAEAAVVLDILDWELADEVEQELWFFRSIADGGVLELPAGLMRAAVGIEYAEEEVEKRNGEVNLGRVGSLPTLKADRDVASVFAELSVPVFESLELSLSARYDDYSDFGDTTNPNIGFNWEPADWLTIYGKWGESFNAPTLLDSVIVANGRYIANAASIVPDPNGERTNPSRDDVFTLEGSGGTLLPQTAESWGLGFDLRPVDNLKISLYYYEIDFDDLLGSFNPQDPQAVLLNPDKFIFEPTDQELANYVAQAANGDQFDDISADAIGVIVDRRIANSDRAELEGYDFGINYAHDTNFGYMDYGLSGNYSAKLDLYQSGAVIDATEYAPTLYISAVVGWNRGGAAARLTFRYTDEYDTNPDQVVNNQRTVDSFLSTNLFLGYNFGGSSDWKEGLSLRFNVDNLFDEEPDEYRTNSINYNEYGFTLGRVYKLGLSYQF